MSDERCRSSDFGLEQALASYVRRRWPSNTLENVSAEWDLTPGEARGVVYEQASRTTLNKVLRHRRGRFRLGIELLEAITGEQLESFIETQAAQAARERAEWEARERRLQRMREDLDALP